MTAHTVTLDEVLRLARRLSPTDQARLRAALPASVDESTAWIAQRQRNQAAIALLDTWQAEAAASETDDEDDAWWEAFMDDIDAYRMSSRPLFPDRTQRQ